MHGLCGAVEAAERQRLHDDGVQDFAIAAIDERDRAGPCRRYVALARPEGGDGGRPPDRRARQIARARNDDVLDLCAVIEGFQAKAAPRTTVRSAVLLLTSSTAVRTPAGFSGRLPCFGNSITSSASPTMK